jgi:fucose 4-O-acetylase-like acetyltransferase
MGADLEASEEFEESIIKVQNLSVARDIRSDYLKALSIIGVVIIHAGLPYADIFRFCVPVFVCLWAFHYEKGLTCHKPEEIWKYVKHKFFRLFIPYIFWTALYIFLFRMPSEWRTTSIHTIVNGWFGGYGWAGQYFFIILFQLTWFFPLLRQWVNSRTVWIMLIAGTVLNASVVYFLSGNRIISVIGDRLFLYWLPYVFLGVAFARGYPRPFPKLLPFAVVLLLTVPSEYSVLAAIDGGGAVYLQPSTVLGSIALLIAISPRLSFNKPYSFPSVPWIGKVVSHIGQNSFIIFVMNPLILKCFHSIDLMSGNLFISIIAKTVLVSITIAISLAISLVLRRLGLSIIIGG